MRSAVLFAICAVTAFAVACSDSGSASDEEPVLVGAEGGTGAAGTGLKTGLPCEVQAVLENRCIACHDGTRPESPRLLDYADLVAPSKVDPAKSMAQEALGRMRSTTSPMPPPPAVPPDNAEIEPFETWVILGTPKRIETCTDAPPPTSKPPTTTPGPTGCTSGKTWTSGDMGSPLMHPGGACNACHQVKGGPNLAIAGTVFPSLHEPNDCNGSAPPPTITVTVTDSKGRVLALPVNAAGNFEIEHTAKLTPPFKASLSNGTKTTAMMGSVTSGDCNSCHTVAGANGAPGRIMAP
jgi:cytochrome c5